MTHSSFLLLHQLNDGLSTSEERNNYTFYKKFRNLGMAQIEVDVFSHSGSVGWLCKEAQSNDIKEEFRIRSGPISPSRADLFLWFGTPTDRRLMDWWLTGCWLVAVVAVSEVLGILHHWDARHPYDNRIRTRIQSTRGDDPVVDMMERAGRVFLATDHSNWTWNDTQRRWVLRCFLQCVSRFNVFFICYFRLKTEGGSDLSARKRLLRTLVSV